jgi:hypothetical protein
MRSNSEREIEIELVLESEKTLYCVINFECQLNFNSGRDRSITVRRKKLWAAYACSPCCAAFLSCHGQSVSYHR